MDENYLAHFGVKGMKWGHRKQKPSGASKTNSKKSYAKGDRPQNEKGSLSTGQKLAIGFAVTGVVLGGVAAYKYRDVLAKTPENLRARKVTNEYLKQFDKTGTTIPKGTEFKRLTSNENEDARSRLYAAYKDHDPERYMSFFPGVIRARTGADDIFQLSYKSKEDIRMPSERTRIHTFVKVLGNPSGKISGGRADLLKALKESGRNITEADLKELRTASAADLSRKYYSTFTGHMYMDNSLNKAYVDRLLKSGFKATVDDFDAKILADTPVILLDSANTTVRSGKIKVTSIMEDAARTLVKTLPEIDD